MKLEDLIDALDGITWYNGIYEPLLKLKEDLINQKVYFRVEVPIVELISSEFNPSCILSCLPFEMDADVILEALWEFKKENRWL